MKSIQARFLAKVRMGASCWIWIGAKNPAGYGQLRIKSAMGGFRISLAHRLSYELYVGPIPTGLVVMHSCDTPSCVNPAHLSVGTQADNLRDAGTKGRMSRGRKSHCPNGHAYAGDNVLTRTDGSHACRECANAPRRRGLRAPYARKRSARLMITPTTEAT